MIELVKALGEQGYYVIPVGNSWSFRSEAMPAKEHFQSTYSTYEAAVEAAYLHSPLGKEDPGCEFSVYLRMNRGTGWTYHNVPDTVNAHNKDEALGKAHEVAEKHFVLPEKYEFQVTPKVLGE